MTRSQVLRKREKLASRVSLLDQVLRGSLIHRLVRHSSGCPKCAAGGGHPLWVLNVNYPGRKTRQVSLRPEQVPQVRIWLENYRKAKQALESISELNQQLLALDRNEATANSSKRGKA